jgi:lysophospholipase L1-like esterase
LKHYLQPSIQEFSNGNHTPFFGQTELINYMKTEQINFLDTSKDFEKKGASATTYYYPIDTHFNKKGYALFGKAVYEEIEEFGYLD